MKGLPETKKCQVFSNLERIIRDLWQLRLLRQGQEDRRLGIGGRMLLSSNYGSVGLILLDVLSIG